MAAKPHSAPTPGWKRLHERSSRPMLVILVWVALHLGRRAGRALLVPIVVYFQLSSRTIRRSASIFLSRALGRRAGAGDVYRNLYTFAACALDRVFLLSGRWNEIHIERHAPPEIVHQLASGGALMLTAHIGSSEVLRVFGGNRRQLNFRIVMDRHHGAMVTRMMEELDPSLITTIIDNDHGPGTTLAVHQALQSKQVVGLMADRTTGMDPGMEVPFLGHQAMLPAAPWQWAAVLGVPVMLCFGLYRGGNRYDLHIETFIGSHAVVPRAQRNAWVQACIQRYAVRLEYYARNAPYNWFNFYNFWADENAGH